MYIPRLRKINQIIKEIKSQDENSALTSYLIYTLVRNNKITSIKFGNEWVVNTDELYEFFKTKDNKK